MSGTQSGNRKESPLKKRPNQETKRNNNRVSACLDIGWALPLPLHPGGRRCAPPSRSSLNDGGGARQNAGVFPVLIDCEKENHSSNSQVIPCGRPHIVVA